MKTVLKDTSVVIKVIKDAIEEKKKIIKRYDFYPFMYPQYLANKKQLKQEIAELKAYLKEIEK